MANDTQPLGDCPDCDEQVTAAWVPITDGQDDPTEGVCAECPTRREANPPEYLLGPESRIYFQLRRTGYY